MNVRLQWLLLVSLFMLLLPMLAHGQEWIWKHKYDEGKALLDKGSYTAAEAPLTEALKLAADFGSPDPRYADTCNLLALTYAGEVRYPEAEKLFLKAIDSLEHTKSADDPAVAKLLNNLGGLYTLAGKPENAEPLFLRALSSLEKKYGTESPELLADLNGLSDYYSIKPDYEKAEKYAKRALAISAKTWGDTDVKLQPCLKTLCQIYVSQQRNSEAEPFLGRLLAMTKTVSGELSTELLWPLEKLGEIYAKGQRVDAAVQTYLQEMVIQRKNLPSVADKNKPPTAAQLKTAYLEFATTLNKLGTLFLAEKKIDNYPSAEKVFIEALSYRRAYLGDASADVAEVTSNLGDTYLLESNFPQALSYYQVTLSIRSKINPQSKETAGTMCSLGKLYFAKQDYPTAEKMYKDARDIDEKTLGADAPEMGGVLACLAVVYLAQDKLGEAEPLFVQAKGILEKAPEANSANLILCLENYARLLEKLERRTESAELLTRVREMREKQQAAADKPAETNTTPAP